MSLVDRFLDRMAVKPKHMACMSVASFHLAIKQLNLKPIPAEDLVTISQVIIFICCFFLAFLYLYLISSSIFSSVAVLLAIWNVWLV